MLDLLTEIEAFCAHHRMSERGFGEQALNDKNFISDLRSGREPRRKTVAKAREWMAAYRAEAA
jgi:hypothetical protein